jgi:hypothetical protein
MPKNTREITLDEAKKLYNSYEEGKAVLLSKFTKDELEGKTVTQEEFNKFFEDNILSTIDDIKTVSGQCLGDMLNNRLIIRNYEDKWLFDYSNTHFLYSYDRVGSILRSKFSLSLSEINRLIKMQLVKNFNLPYVTPQCVVLN